MKPIYRDAKWHKDNLIIISKFIKRYATHWSKRLVKDQESPTSSDFSRFDFEDEEFEYSLIVRREKRLKEEE